MELIGWISLFREWINLNDKYGFRCPSIKRGLLAKYIIPTILACEEMF